MTLKSLTSQVAHPSLWSPTPFLKHLGWSWVLYLSYLSGTPHHVLRCPNDLGRLSLGGDALESQDEVYVTQFLGSGSVGNVYRGCLQGITSEDVVVKMVREERSEAVRLEAEIYNVLLPLQGLHIPTVYGLFMEEHFYVLIMKYVGETLTSFEGLSVSQR